MEQRAHEQVGDKMARWAEVMRWFDRWLESDDAERVRVLADLQANDAQLHALLLRAIETDREAEAMRFLDVGAMLDVARGESTENVIPDMQGERVGPWRIERLLGVGGMGQVWLVARDDGRHAGRAALKMLRFTALNRAGQARFAREGELLARLQHPHVARLLDVGETADRQLYLVLEYVEGERIDDWCDLARAGVEARLRLFLQVCEAIAYAHANLIVHRDLKPSNILVRPDGTAKVLDFGMAKLLESEALSGELTELTRAAGAAFTPEYAAPEQFEGAQVTVATDVYSLGVVLYVLLTGRRPHGDDSATPGQLARARAESEPRRPSSRVDEATGDTDRIAASRATTPAQLRRALRGDLDTILAKALKRVPAERYATVQALADDIRRYLEHRPITARADSLWYRLRKYVQRNRWGVGAGLLFALAVGAGAAATAWEATLARRAARRAETEAAKSAQIARFTRGMLTGVDPQRAKSMDRSLVRLMLDTAASNAQRELAQQAEVRASIEDTIATSYFSIGEYELAGQHWQAAIDAAQAAGLDVRTRARFMAQRALSIANRAQYREGYELALAALALLDGVDPDDPARLFVEARVAGLACTLFRPQECHDRLMSVYPAERRMLGDDDPETMYALANLTQAETLLGDHAAAKAHYLEAIGRMRARYGEDSSQLLNLVLGLSRNNSAANRSADNIALLTQHLPDATRVLGEKHPITLAMQLALGVALNEAQRYDEARPHLEKAVELLTQVRGRDSVQTVNAEDALIRCLIGLGDLRTAEPRARELIARNERTDSHAGSLLRLTLFQIFMRQHRYTEAEAEVNASFAAQPESKSRTIFDLLVQPHYQAYVDLYTAWGKPEQAQAWRDKWKVAAAAFEPLAR